MNTEDKLKALRAEMKKQKLDGYIIPRSDEYLGEYVPESAERLAWLTDFTGSAGVAIILEDRAVVMSDGRYTIQLAQQVDARLYTVEDNTKTPIYGWLKSHAKQNDTIGFCSKFFPSSTIEKNQSELSDNEITLKSVSEDLVDSIWIQKPAPPKAKVKVFPEEVAGIKFQDKLALVAAQLKERGADLCFITLSDSIAWLLNIRGDDIPHIPVALSYLAVKADGQADWFIDPAKMTDEVRNHLGNHVSMHNPDTLDDYLSGLADTQAVWLDPKRTPLWFFEQVKRVGAILIDAKDPCIDPRACKTQAEQNSMRAAHIRDGVAMVKFLKWLEETATNGQETELSVEVKLEEIRAQAPEWRGSSFDTIAGFNAHGAIVHYRASEETSLPITSPGLLLLDSGAQYADGTTDITRTVAIGQPTDDMLKHNTLVLKGHIAVASAVFEDGTLGKDIDALARAPLKEHGLDFAHGTGHGVGCYLSVHEEAANFSARGEEPPKPGMIISNEPGYYEEGQYGIRIENLVLVKESVEEGMFEFETITLAPLDTSLIAKEMLTKDELNWLNAYHTRVYETLAPLLDTETADWLKQKTASL